MNEPTLDNAFAFGEYFMDLYSYVVATGDTSEWLEVSHPDCIFCASVTDGVRQGHREATRIALAQLQGRQLNDQYFALDYQLSEWPDDALEAISYPASVGVYFIGDKWSIRAVEIHEAANAAN